MIIATIVSVVKDVKAIIVGIRYSNGAEENEMFDLTATKETVIVRVKERLKVFETIIAKETTLRSDLQGLEISLDEKEIESLGG
jgi:hypothetical protein